MRIAPNVGWTCGLLLVVAGCKSSTGWGHHSSLLTVDDDPPIRVSGGVSARPNANSDRHQNLCDVTGLRFSITAHHEIGDVVGFEVTLSEPLCHEGDIPVRSGFLVFKGNPGNDPNVTTGIPSDEWTVYGTVTVDYTKDHHPPRLEKGDEAVAWSAGGSFDLEATHPSGATMSLTAGRFDFEITWREYEFD